VSFTLAEREGWSQVGTWLDRWADRAPDRVALLDAGRDLGYAALAERCARAAGVLRELGVQRGDRFALLLGNASPALELVFAAARLGAIAVPLNARLTAYELSGLIADAEPRLLVHDADHAAQAERAAPALPRLGCGGAHDAYEAALAAASPAAAIASSPEDAMLLMYTSGTTGRPKGALLPQRKALYNSSNAERCFQLTRADCVGIPLPLYHSFALSILALPALFGGARCALQPRFDAAELWRLAADAGITYFGAVPTQLRMLLEARSTLSAETAEDLRSLRFVFSAGAALPVSLIEAFAQFGIVVKQGYGQTETSLLCSLDAADALRKAGSVGRPVHHVELRVIARDSLAAPVAEWRGVAVGETGEITVRGPIAMLGYWRQPEASAEALREGWLRTGDLARVDDEGFVYLAGRSRDLYISGGENVYPAEIEALLETHASVREVAVVGVPDEHWGEVGRAYVVPVDPLDFDPEALLAFARERLASFKLPKSIRAVKALPRTETGKVQKHRLAEAAGGGTNSIG
jgi:fatty-acyl-CoA synthase